MIKKWRIVVLLTYLLVHAGIACAIEDIPPCYRDLEINFFKYDVTAQAFSTHRIGQSQWNLLVNALQNRSKDVPALVSAQAAQMNPNPLQRPFQVVTAVAILQNALYVVFRQVMLENYVLEVTNEVAIKQMFEHIWFNQRLRMTSCLGEAAFAKDRITE